ARFGLRTSAISYNYPTLRAWKDLAVKRTGAGGNRKYYENEGITTIHGEAHFLSPHEISVNRRNYSAASFLVATGSDSLIPDIQGLADSDYDTPRTMLDAIRPPKTLYIIGGGTSSVELAQLMAIFGTKVYIAEIAARLLPDYDSEAGETLEKLLAAKNITVLTQTRTLVVEKENIAHRIIYGRGGQEHSLRVDAVLIAAGSTPNVDIGLENAGVLYDANGIHVNEYLQTNVKHIYGAGDVIGRHSYTHTALLESRIAVSNLISKNKLIPDYVATPKVVFTYPQIASVGLTEDDCLRRDLNIKKAFAPLNIVTRSNTSDFRDGFVKIICDKKGVVIGATIMAPGAGELIHELALAIKYGLTATEVAATPHAFLTWSEAIRVAAGKLA
ncbi:MAG: putative FAD-dependent pyridine nucleotide-disulfide oxidoreductase, partial [Candidatus Saccharibacteria bacterium]|nr:putative FAD-dependent pyridine nucleotide-disulfide oxidoreductase [Candidatus Saccharibacteria bacterium]